MPRCWTARCTPRWVVCTIKCPVGFGDNERAGSYLRKALSIAPNDIDANYFYADYLIEEGKYADAVGVLEKALNAPPRAQRDVADAGRKKEVQALLEMARDKT